MKTAKHITKEDLGGKFFIAADGTWFHNGTAFPAYRQNMVKLFAQYLKRKENGEYWIQVIIENRLIDEAQVIVEDAPFVIIAMQIEKKAGQDLIVFRTNLDESLTLGTKHPLQIDFTQDNNPQPYILVRDGLQGKLSRAVFTELADHAVLGLCPHSNQYKMGVWSQNIFFPLEA